MPFTMEQSVRRFTKRSNLKGLLYSFSFLLLIAATGTAAYLAFAGGQWLLLAVALYVHGKFYNFFGNALHEGSDAEDVPGSLPSHPHPKAGADAGSAPTGGSSSSSSGRVRKNGVRSIGSPSRTWLFTRSLLRRASPLHPSAADHS